MHYIGFPGACDVCGGSQHWTLHSGSVWVACDACDLEQAELFGLPSLYAKGSEFSSEEWNGTLEGKEGKTL